MKSSSGTASGKQPVEDECTTSSTSGDIVEDKSSEGAMATNYKAETTDSTMQPKSYNKAGYSVVISNGTLWHANEEKGIVKMKTGTQFYIAIANINDLGELNTHLDNTYFQNTTVIENSVIEIFSVLS